VLYAVKAVLFAVVLRLLADCFPQTAHRLSSVLGCDILGHREGDLSSLTSESAAQVLSGINSSSDDRSMDSLLVSRGASSVNYSTSESTANNKESQGTLAQPAPAIVTASAESRRSEPGQSSDYSRPSTFSVWLGLSYSLLVAACAVFWVTSQKIDPSLTSWERYEIFVFYLFNTPSTSVSILSALVGDQGALMRRHHRLLTFAVSLLLLGPLLTHVLPAFLIFFPVLVPMALLVIGLHRVTHRLLLSKKVTDGRHKVWSPIVIASFSRFLQVFGATLTVSMAVNLAIMFYRSGSWVTDNTYFGLLEEESDARSMFCASEVIVATPVNVLQYFSALLMPF
jgi:hypothetical protein